MLSTYSDGVAAGGESAILATINWISGLLQGQLGTAVAVLAIAGVGFSMLMGYASPRACLKVVVGCFILFGAPAIAHGLVQFAHQGREPVATEVLTPPPPPVAHPPPPAPNPDPYGGASVPM